MNVSSFGYLHNSGRSKLCIFPTNSKKDKKKREVGGQKMNEYVNSDLAVEKKGFWQTDDSCYIEEEGDDFTVCRLNIENSEDSKKYGREKGHYVTVFCDKIWLMDNEAIETMAYTVSHEIEKMLFCVCRKPVSEQKVLVVGLGNPDMTSDAIGPFTVRQMMVTRHLGGFYKKIFGDKRVTSVSALAPGVLSQTGIETVEIIKSAVDSVLPDAVIAVDSLAARSCERLGSTVQLFDNGISPGSGVGNTRKAIDKKNVGVPVIALGVPTVVDSSTLVYDALEKAGVSTVSDELHKVLTEGRGFFVSPKESDVIAKSASGLLAAALDITFGTRV